MIEGVVSDLGLDPQSASYIHDSEEKPSGRPPSCLVISKESLGTGGDPAVWSRTAKSISPSRLPPEGCVLLELPPVSPGKLAALRNALWPDFHVPAVYRFQKGRPVERLDLSGVRRVASLPNAGYSGCLMAAVTREAAMNPKAVEEKFDRNARGWNGVPGAPTYGHFRWMRRLMAAVAGPHQGRRVLDAGCGAGWVGIEAALMGGQVSAFDPSPEMIRIAARNAADQGVKMVSQVGFGESPPFDEPFDTVISSGVISFSPDPERFMDGLDAVVKPGGILVVGDVNPHSLGMAVRRARRPVLPFRELNGVKRSRIVEMARARGYTVEKTRYYQLTLPVPFLMHLSEFRLGGLGCSLLLLLNRWATVVDGSLGSIAGCLFDSYIVRARKRAAPVSN